MNQEQEEFLGVYREIAATAIQNWELYKKNPEEARREARATAKRDSIDDLENNHVWGKDSISAAIESLVKQLGLSDNIDPASVVGDIYSDREGDSQGFGAIGERLRGVDNINKVIIQALSDIHDRWCKDNAKKFFEAGRNKQFQHQELELIGWKEAKNDLVFLEPILKKMGIDINMGALELEYLARQAEFLKDHNIYSVKGHRDYTSRGEYLERLASELEDGSKGKKVMEASVDSLRNNGEIVSQVEKDKDGNVIWKKDVKDEIGNKVPEKVLGTIGSMDAIMEQSEKRAEIDYPISFAQIKEELNNLEKKFGRDN